MHHVNYNDRTSYVSNYFYGRIRPKGLLYDAERDLLTIAKFLVLYVSSKISDLRLRDTITYCDS